MNERRDVHMLNFWLSYLVHLSSTLTQLRKPSLGSGGAKACRINQEGGKTGIVSLKEDILKRVRAG